MRVAIAGAGNVGRQIATDLAAKGHSILLIDPRADVYDHQRLPLVDWLAADACEVESLTRAHLESCDVAIAASGDDKVNLVFSLLAKTEFAVARTVARVNRPDNQWLFNDMWGIDVAVSTPSIMGSLAEEAVSVGDLIRLFSFQSSSSSLVELTLPSHSSVIGRVLADLEFPGLTVLVAVIRDGRGLAPQADMTLESADELLFICPASCEAELSAYLTDDSNAQRSTAEVRSTDDAASSPDQSDDYLVI
ncbi:MAG: TrkA family potassium uptake protein [Propionibacteriaceae bacterium]|jgi:trk system potassium uptake protein TrkA|nr:TrkA family potassium uptake protein [Propionibacteriaceae bacterium]